MSALAHLEQEAGLQAVWEDAAGERQTVSEDNLRAVLAALGLPAETDAEITESRERLAIQRAEGARRFVTAVAGEPIALPAGMEAPFVLELESGERRELESGATVIEGIDQVGYHRLSHSGGETVLAVAPPRCFGVRDISGKGSLWGVSAQLPSLRDTEPAPFGDFGTLARTVPALAKAGADLVAISPVHALFPADPQRFSPYAPSSRRFLNILFADTAPSGVQKGTQEAHSGSELIDWETVLPQRLAQLRHRFESADPAERNRLATIERVPEVGLHSHALYDALHAHFTARGKHGWRAWPAEYHDPQSDAVRQFAKTHGEDIAFFAWSQGLADAGLAKAQQAARDAGMACGIVTDLAVGIDPGGSDCWTARRAFLDGLSVGAPPDLLGPDGQDWGLTTFNPLTLHAERFQAFRDTLGAAMVHAGGVRIDHILGLRRIWVVPHGRSSAEGCYLAMPQRDLANVLALESHRHACLVIGEDLGTVPAGFRDEMASRDIYGMRVLWFERAEDGGYTNSKGWDEKAVAMTSTHDLPTLAGWWSGRDIDWTWRIGRKSAFDDRAAEDAHRIAERAQIWDHFVQAGHAAGDPPDAPAPFVSAGIAHVADSACDLTIVPLEDLFGASEQPNLPGTIDEHPNWRRRLPEPVETGLQEPDTRNRIETLRKGTLA
ncbi:MAG: 4-alpha-glucanotransferase [Erythrobacter sp.]